MARLNKAAFLVLILLITIGAHFFSAHAVDTIRRRIPENKAVVGIVEKMLNKGFIQRSGKRSREDLSLGFRVFENDILYTEQSRLHVRYKDGTYIELGEQSAFQVERLRFRSEKDDGTVFRLLYGVARVVANDIHGLKHFTVKTNNAVVKVMDQSDAYILQPQEIRDLTVAVTKGKVHLWAAVTNHNLVIEAGHAGYVRVSGMVTEAGRLSLDLISYVRSRTRM